MEIICYVWLGLLLLHFPQLMVFKLSLTDIQSVFECNKLMQFEKLSTPRQKNDCSIAMTIIFPHSDG